MKAKLNLFSNILLDVRALIRNRLVSLATLRHSLRGLSVKYKEYGDYWNERLTNYFLSKAKAARGAARAVNESILANVEAYILRSMAREAIAPSKVKRAIEYIWRLSNNRDAFLQTPQIRALRYRIESRARVIEEVQQRVGHKRRQG